MLDTTSASYELAAQSRSDDHLDDIVYSDVRILAACLKLFHDANEDVVVRETIRELLACTEEKKRRSAHRKGHRT